MDAEPSPRTTIHLEYVPQKSLEYKSPRSLVCERRGFFYMCRIRWLTAPSLILRI
nr:MAG TPA: hypothetical protein [Caudoviricetes sp.]